MNIGWAAVAVEFVLAVGIKLRQQQERFLKGHECHWYCGSERYGGLRAKKMVLVPWGYREY